jgi:hypothetical protein
MRSIRFPALVLLALCASIACSDYGSGPRVHEIANVSITLSTSMLEVGQAASGIAVPLDQYGEPVDKGPVTWTSSFPEVAVVQPTTGQILAIAPGNTQIVATVAGKEGRRALTVSPPPILINEINPNGDAAGGWVELFNPTARAVDMTGWTITSDDVFHSATFAPGTMIPSGGYFIVEEASFPAGLKASDGVHLFNRFGVQSDGASWQTNPATTLGRCPHGQGAVTATLAPTKGTANTCP